MGSLGGRKKKKKREAGPPDDEKRVTPLFSQKPPPGMGSLLSRRDQRSLLRIIGTASLRGGLAKALSGNLSQGKGKPQVSTSRNKHGFVAEERRKRHPAPKNEKTPHPNFESFQKKQKERSQSAVHHPKKPEGRRRNLHLSARKGKKTTPPPRPRAKNKRKKTISHTFDERKGKNLPSHENLTVAAKKKRREKKDLQLRNRTVEPRKESREKRGTARCSPS